MSFLLILTAFNTTIGAPFSEGFWHLRQTKEPFRGSWISVVYLFLQCRWESFAAVGFWLLLLPFSSQMLNTFFLILLLILFTTHLSLTYALQIYLQVPKTTVFQCVQNPIYSCSLQNHSPTLKKVGFIHSTNPPFFRLEKSGFANCKSKLDFEHTEKL